MRGTTEWKQSSEIDADCVVSSFTKCFLSKHYNNKPRQWIMQQFGFYFKNQSVRLRVSTELTATAGTTAFLIRLINTVIKINTSQEPGHRRPQLIAFTWCNWNSKFVFSCDFSTSEPPSVTTQVSQVSTSLMLPFWWPLTAQWASSHSANSHTSPCVSTNWPLKGNGSKLARQSGGIF